VPTERGPVEFAEIGEGPAALVGHGTPGGYDQGLALAGLIPDAGLRFVAVSRPGYLGTPLEVGRTPPEQADAFANLLDALGVERVAMVGLSGGGPSAWQFALRHPDRCWALALISAITRQRPASQRSLGWRLFHKVILPSDFAAWLGVSLVRALMRPTPRRPVGRVGPEQSRRLMEATVPYAVRRAGHKNDSEQFGALPESPPEGIRCPTLVVHGTADGAVPFTHAKASVAAIPGAELVTLPGGGHGAFFRSEAAMTRLAEFLAAHAPA
jgi:pimeloyl-ACP methyl ester carboxylesterase